MMGDKVFSLEELSDLSLQQSGMCMAYEAVLRGLINAEPSGSPVLKSVIEWLQNENTRIESIALYETFPSEFRETVYRIFQYRTDIDAGDLLETAAKAEKPPVSLASIGEHPPTNKPKIIKKQELLIAFFYAIRNATALDTLSIAELKILLALGSIDSRWVEMSEIRAAFMGPGENTFPKYVRRLTEFDLVAKRVAPSDMRKRELSLTKKGRDQVSVIYRSAVNTLGDL